MSTPNRAGQTVPLGQRRARLALRHRLARPAGSPEEVAGSLVALHATDPATVFLSVRARAPGADVAAVEDALYTRRSLLRMLGMRRTMFVVPDAAAPVVQAAATDAIAVAQRRRYVKLMIDGGAGDGTFLAEVEEAALAALAARGEATGAQLSADEPRLRTQLLVPDKAHGGAQSITSWVLLLLAAEGRIVRGRPNGSWLSSQWRWAPAEDWLPGGMPRLEAAPARAELARRWLAAFGPGTTADLKWWTGWTVAQTKQALAAAGAVEVGLEGPDRAGPAESAGSGWLLPEDLGPVPEPGPWVALLPGLDPTPMGWQDRSWFLGPHRPQVFDTNGNVGPTVWADGRIVGGWAQRRDGEIAVRLLEDVGTEATAAIGAEASRAAAWIGDVRVTPRFRTPLERELSS